MRSAEAVAAIIPSNLFLLRMTATHDSETSALYFPAFCAAQRFFCASAIRLRASGLNTRLVPAGRPTRFFATGAVAVF